MKRILLLFLLLTLPAGAFSQSIQITSSGVSTFPGGINVNVQTVSLNGAGYLGHSYTITGMTVDLSVCYYFNMTLPVLTFNDNFFIPLDQPGDYTVNITVYNSSSTTQCDYFSIGDTATHTLLSAGDFGNGEQHQTFAPNPTNGSIAFSDEKPFERIGIFDQLGRLVLQQTNANTIDLTSLNIGVYVIRGETANKTFTQKIIKH